MISIIMFWCTLTIYAQTNIKDSLALVALYNSTNGQNWTNNTNWLTGPVDTWYGISTINNRVVRIFLNGAGLDGTLPTEIRDLTEVQLMWLIGNDLYGIIPDQIGNMTSLTSVNFTGNRLSGTIPSTIVNLVNLYEFSANSNRLSGSIPPEFGALPLLKTLSLSRNDLTGNIPSTLGDAPWLEAVELQFNMLDGLIPVELARPTNLRLVNLHDNQLSGPIPEDFGNLIFLTGLSLQNNFLNGSIPVNLGLLDNLLVLDLSNNQLIGGIPEELGGMTSILNLYLNDNNLNEQIALGIAAVGNLPALRELKLQNNNLVGPLPLTLGNLPSLRKLIANNNNLSGFIPSQISNISTIEEIVLNDNNFVGEVPFSLTNLSGLKYLQLHNNNIENLPDFSSMSSLLYFSVENNKLTFEDIEPNKDLTFGSFIYSPQQKVGTIDAFSVNAGNIIVMSTVVGGSDNVYEWLKDGIPVAGGMETDLKVSDFQASDAGVYECVVISKIVSGLSITREPIELSLNSSLPVEFSSFTAKPSGLKVQLDWITSFEEDNAYFKLERSKDGIVFEAFATIAGRGNQSEANSYSDIDTNPFFGISYYRIKQFDSDGTFNYSPVVSVKLSRLNENEIYPNPVVQGLPITFKGKIKGIISISIYDLTGVEVYVTTPQYYNRFQEIIIPTNDLQTGLYLLSVENTEKNIVRKIIVK